MHQKEKILSVLEKWKQSKKNLTNLEEILMQFAKQSEENASFPSEYGKFSVEIFDQILWLEDLSLFKERLIAIPHTQSAVAEEILKNIPGEQLKLYAAVLQYFIAIFGMPQEMNFIVVEFLIPVLFLANKNVSGWVAERVEAFKVNHESGLMSDFFNTQSARSDWELFAENQQFMPLARSS